LELARELTLELALTRELARELALELALTRELALELSWESAEPTTEAECTRLEAESSAEVLRVQVDATKEVRIVDEPTTVVEKLAEATSMSISGESAIAVHMNAIRTEAHDSTIETLSLEIGMIAR